MRTKQQVTHTRVRTLFINAFAVLGLCSGAALATDYNDAYWSSPTRNADFSDNFASPSLNRNFWDVITNVYVNGEDQDYRDIEYPAADWTVRSGQSDAAASDGKVLNLKARFMDGQVQNYYGGVAGQGKPLLVRGGRIESKIADNTTFTYGKFEARIKMPPARNAEFPAWWLLGNFPDVGWTACQELDIIEFTGNSPLKAPQTHWSAPYVIYGGNPVDNTYAGLGIDPSNQYITYGVIKTPDYVEFYVNGVKAYTFSRTNMGEQQPWPYVSPMRMILNHAITHVEWPAVGNYNLFSTDPNVANRTGYTKVVNGVTQYEYLDVASMATNIGREGTDFLVDYVAHWPLPSTDPLEKYTDNSKSSFFRPTNNTKGFYSLKGWLAPVAVTGDAYLDEGNATDLRSNGADNAADGYVGSKWATPKDDNLHTLEIDYGSDKPIKYLWIEWSWNLPKSYDIYGKSATGKWEFILTSNQDVTGWAKHVFDINKSYRYLKLVTKGRIDKSDSIWLLELMAFEDVANVYPKPASTNKIDRNVNVLSNGTFTNDIAGWKGEVYDGTAATYTSVNGEAKITAVKEGANQGSYQFHTSAFGLKANYRYEISFKARAETPRNMVVRLGDNSLNPGTAGIYLERSVALSTAMSSQSFIVDMPTDSDGRLSFRLGKQGSFATVYLDDVVIREVGYIGVGAPLVKAIDANNFVSASPGWTPDWWGIAKRAVDGSTANKASGKEGASEGLDLSVNIKLDPEYEIKQVLVAGDKSAPRTLAQFKIEYGANYANTLMDWTNSTKDGVYEAFNTFASQPSVSERDFKLSFRPPAGQLVEVADVQFMAVDHKPYRIYTLGLDSGGKITPDGTLRYSKNNTDSATYNFNPEPGYAVADVIIDGVSMGASNSYTFNNIATSHTLAVAYSKTATPTLVSESRPISASSQVQSANNAVDGKSTSRWESTHGVSPSWIAIDLGAPVALSSVVIDWEGASAGSYIIQGSNNNSLWDDLKPVTGGASGKRTDTNTVAGTYRYLRIYCTARSAGNVWGYSIYELKVYGVGGTAVLAATASATSQPQPASNAVDGSLTTRWESSKVDANSLTLDLGSAKTLASIAINWGSTSAASYTVQGSNDNNVWTDIASVTGAASGTRNDILALSGSYRYVRINCIARATGSTQGYSIWEVRVFGG
jgi:hypothetical protein